MRNLEVCASEQPDFTGDAGHFLISALSHTTLGLYLSPWHDSWLTWGDTHGVQVRCRGKEQLRALRMDPQVNLSALHLGEMC